MSIDDKGSLGKHGGCWDSESKEEGCARCTCRRKLIFFAADLPACRVQHELGQAGLFRLEIGLCCSLSPHYLPHSKSPTPCGSHPSSPTAQLRMAIGWLLHSRIRLPLGETHFPARTRMMSMIMGLVGPQYLTVSSFPFFFFLFFFPLFGRAFDPEGGGGVGWRVVHYRTPLRTLLHRHKEQDPFPPSQSQ